MYRGASESACIVFILIILAARKAVASVQIAIEYITTIRRYLTISMSGDYLFCFVIIMTSDLS